MVFNKLWVKEKGQWDQDLDIPMQRIHFIERLVILIYKF